MSLLLCALTISVFLGIAAVTVNSGDDQGLA
jgi:hypothetical protein